MAARSAFDTHRFASCCCRCFAFSRKLVVFRFCARIMSPMGAPMDCQTCCWWYVEFLVDRVNRAHWCLWRIVVSRLTDVLLNFWARSMSSLLSYSCYPIPLHLIGTLLPHHASHAVLLLRGGLLQAVARQGIHGRWSNVGVV